VGWVGKVRTLIATAVAFGLVFVSAAEATQFAYEPNFAAGGGVAGLSVGADGGLSALPGSPFTTSGEQLEGLAISPDAKHLFTAGFSATPKHLYAFTIGADGALTPAGMPQTIGNAAIGVVVTPDGRRVYVANRSSGTISAFSVAADASLSELPVSPMGTPAEPSGVVVSADGKFLYVAHSDASGMVSAYAIQANGSLSALTGSPYATGTAPYALNLTPNGKFLYAAARGPDNKVFGFSVNADGTLTALASTPPSTGSNPFGMTITPDGSQLLTTNYNGASISGFSIGTDGTLTPTGTTADPDNPADATTDAGGTRLFASNGVRTSVDVFTIASSGPLTAVSGSPFASGVRGDFQSIALTPDQPPAASFTVSGGKHASFNAASSADLDGGSVARYDWNFGDGTTLANGGPTPTHDYRKGNFTATLTVTDDQGCSTTYVSAGETAFCNGSGVATASKQVVAAGLDLRLSGKKHQALGKPIKLKARCDDACSADATGKLKIAGEGKFKLKRKSRELAADALGLLKLKLPGKARAAARDASKGKATVEVTATDKLGNETTLRFKAKLRG
jgi:6-phosphogluconolactonase (cycloisomerase 2 family)